MDLLFLEFVPPVEFLFLFAASLSMNTLAPAARAQSARGSFMLFLKGCVGADFLNRGLYCILVWLLDVLLVAVDFWTPLAALVPVGLLLQLLNAADFDLPRVPDTIICPLLGLLPLPPEAVDARVHPLLSVSAEIYMIGGQ